MEGRWRKEASLLNLDLKVRYDHTLHTGLTTGVKKEWLSHRRRRFQSHGGEDTEEPRLATEAATMQRQAGEAHCFRRLWTPRLCIHNPNEMGIQGGRKEKRQGEVNPSMTADKKKCAAVNVWFTYVCMGCYGRPGAMVTKSMRSHGTGLEAKGGEGGEADSYLTSLCLLFPSGLSRCVVICIVSVLVRDNCAIQWSLITHTGTTATPRFMKM